MRTVFVAGLLACSIWPLTASAEQLDGKPDLVGVSAYYGYAVAVGKRGAVYIFDRRKKTWKRQVVADKSNLTGVAMVSHRDIWAMGSNGRVLRLNRSRWSLVPGIDKGTYNGFAMAGRSRGAAVGNGGTIFHLVQSSTQATWGKYYASPIKADLYAVARVGRGGRERFVAVGKGGAVLALSGVGRSVLADMEISQTKQDLVAIAACRGYRAEAVAVGRDVVLRDRRNGTWKKLPSIGQLTGVAVKCRYGRVRTIYATMGNSIVWLDLKSRARKPGTWKKHTVGDVKTLRGITWLGSKRLLVVGDAGSVAIVAVKHLGKTWRNAPNNPATLPSYPKTKQICRGRVYVRGRGHLSWRMHATPAERSKVLEFFERRLGRKQLESTKHSDTFRFPKDKPTMVLSIRPVNTLVNRPRCKVPKGTKTVIEHSRFPSRK